MSKLKELLQDYVDETGASQSGIGRAVGYSASVISQYLDGIYKGDVKAVETAIEQFLALEQERRAQPKETLTFLPIASAKKVLALVRAAHINGEIAVLHGDPGLGKTFNLEHYQSKYPRKVILIEAHKGYSPRALIVELHAMLGGDGAGSQAYLTKEIIKLVRGGNRCVIIDEADHLNLGCLEIIRHIHDKTGCGLVLAGTQKLMMNLRGKRKQLEQLYSRVGDAIRIDRLSPEDTEKMVAAALPNSNGLWKAFHEQCNGNARILSHFIRRSRRLAERNHSEVTPEIVNRIARQHKDALGIA